MGQQLLEEPLSELVFDLLDLLGLLASVFGRDSFAFLLGTLFLLSPLFDFLFRSRFLEGPLCGLLLQDDEAHRPQRGGDQDRDEDELPSQAFAADDHFLVDLLELLLEPLHLELQAANLLVELFGRGCGIVVPAGQSQALAVGLLQLPELGGSGACGSAGKPSPVRKT